MSNQPADFVAFPGSPELRRIPRHPCGLLSLSLLGLVGAASAAEPCGDFGECKALIEINSSDGDIGFHFLVDGDDLRQLSMEHGTDGKIFQYGTFGALREQTLTETFAESAEPPCRMQDADPGDPFVTLEEFLERWPEATISFFGKGEADERPVGAVALTHALPAAPVDVAFDGSVVSWAQMPANPDAEEAMESLGRCTDGMSIAEIEDLLETPPWLVPVVQWEVVFEADVEPGEPGKGLKMTARVPPEVLAVTIPADFLAAFPPDTPAKIEVGAIGYDDNATFTEEGDLCVNVDEGCEDEE